MNIDGKAKERFVYRRDPVNIKITQFLNISITKRKGFIVENGKCKYGKCKNRFKNYSLICSSSIDSYKNAQSNKYPSGKLEKKMMLH